MGAILRPSAVSLFLARTCFFLAIVLLAYSCRTITAISKVTCRSHSGIPFARYVKTLQASGYPGQLLVLGQDTTRLDPRRELMFLGAVYSVGRDEKKKEYVVTMLSPEGRDEMPFHPVAFDFEPTMLGEKQAWRIFILNQYVQKYFVIEEYTYVDSKLKFIKRYHNPLVVDGLDIVLNKDGQWFILDRYVSSALTRGFGFGGDRIVTGSGSRSSVYFELEKEYAGIGYTEGKELLMIPRSNKGVEIFQAEENGLRLLKTIVLDYFAYSAAVSDKNTLVLVGGSSSFDELEKTRLPEVRMRIADYRNNLEKVDLLYDKEGEDLGSIGRIAVFNQEIWMALRGTEPLRYCSFDTPRQ